MGKWQLLRCGTSKLIAAAACLALPPAMLAAQAPPAPQAPAAAPNGARPAAGAFAAEDGQWTMPSKDYASTRFSGLGEINLGNISQLRLVFRADTRSRRGHEAPPLVIGTMMYVLNPFPNDLMAIDISDPRRPRLK